MVAEEERREANAAPKTRQETTATPSARNTAGRRSGGPIMNRYAAPHIRPIAPSAQGSAAVNAFQSERGGLSQ